MKTVYTWLVAGMLATATATPAVQARPLVEAAASIDNETVLRLLGKAVEPLSSQLGSTLSLDMLYQAYQDGQVQIHYIGFDGIVHMYQVVYQDGGIGVVDVNDY